MHGHHAASKCMAFNAIRGKLSVTLVCVMLQAGQGGRSALAQKLLGPWSNAPRSARADFSRYLQLVARLLGGEASSQEVEVGSSPCTASHFCPFWAGAPATACQLQLHVDVTAVRKVLIPALEWRMSLSNSRAHRARPVRSDCGAAPAEVCC